VIPVGAPLQTVLDARRPERAEGPILRNTFGDPCTGDDDLHFHDLRGTAVRRLSLSGCTTPQIAAITGHSPRDVDEILKAHYLGGQAELAEQAIVKLVAVYGRSA
jgi:integrase